MLERRLSPPEDEAAYRHQYLASDSSQAALLAAIGTLGSCVFVRNDWLLLGDTPTFWSLVVTRALFLAVSIACITTILRTKDPRVLDRMVAIFIAALVLENVYIISTRPPEYLGPNVPLLVVVNVLYLAVPGPLVARMIGAICLSVVSFLFSARVPGVLLGNSASIVSHCLAHFIGIPISMRMARLRRSQFQSQMAEKRTRQQLEAEEHHETDDGGGDDRTGAWRRSAAPRSSWW